MNNYVDMETIRDFVSCYENSSMCISDAISEYADSHTSIYYGDIMYFIKHNVEYVDDIINEYGWDNCGSSLYSAGQFAESIQIENELNNAIDYIIQCIIISAVDDNYIDDNAHDITEQIIDEYSSDFDDSNSFADIYNFVNDAIYHITNDIA